MNKRSLHFKIKIISLWIVKMVACYVLRNYTRLAYKTAEYLHSIMFTLIVNRVFVVCKHLKNFKYDSHYKMFFNLKLQHKLIF